MIHIRTLTWAQRVFSGNTALRCKRALASKRIKVLALGLAALVLGTIVVVARLELHLAVQQILDRQGTDIVYDAFDSRIETVIHTLGPPEKIEALRENEKLVYWNFGPVTLQIHFFKDRVSRMAYIAKDASRRVILTTEIIEEFGGKEIWERRLIESDGAKQLVLINRREGITLVNAGDAVLLYGYIMK